MKIKLMMPVYASAEFEADIDIEGKTAEEILDEFYNKCENNGYLCHQCARYIETDFTIDDENIDYIVDQIKIVMKENK